MKRKLRKIKKAFLAFLLVIICMVGVLGTPGTALAGEAVWGDYRYGDWEYIIMDDGTVHIVVYIGSDAVLEIPSEIDGRAVTGFNKDVYPPDDDGCNITTLIIPETVTNIPPWGHTSNVLEEIVVKEGNPAFRSKGGVVYDKQMKTLLWCPEGKRGVLTVPEGVEAIGEYAFEDSRLSEIRLPDSLREIGKGAFYECRFTGIDIPESVEAVGERAFGSCEKLKEVRLPEGIKVISDGMFYNCGKLTGIYLPEGVTAIKYCAFCNCDKLKSIRLPKGLKSIGEDAFRWCDGLESIVIPEGTASVGDFAFCLCKKLESVNIPDSVKEIGESAFYGSKKAIIECSDKSYAKSYALKYGIPYRIVKKASGSRLGLTLNGQSVKDGQTLKAKEGKSYTLQAVRGGEKAEVKWKTSNAKVAAVKAGKVTVKKAGSATITATAPDGKKTRIKLSAAKAAVRVSKVQVSGSKTMKRGSKQVLGLTVAPATADNTKVSWKSSDAKIATVDKAGKVTAKKKGTVVITATAKDKSRKKGSIKITVK